MILAMTALALAAQEVQVAVPPEVLAVCAGEAAAGCESEEIELAEEISFDMDALSSVEADGPVGGGGGGGRDSGDFTYCRTDRPTAARRSEEAVDTTFRIGAVHRQKSVETSGSTVQVFVGYRPSPRKFYYVDVDLSRVPSSYSAGSQCRVTVRSVNYVEGVGKGHDDLSRRVFAEIRRALK